MYQRELAPPPLGEPEGVLGDAVAGLVGDHPIGDRHLAPGVKPFLLDVEPLGVLADDHEVCAGDGPRDRVVLGRPHVGVEVEAAAEVANCPEKPRYLLGGTGGGAEEGGVSGQDLFHRFFGHRGPVLLKGLPASLGFDEDEGEPGGF